MKCDELKSLWVYCRDINEDEDEDFIEFAKKNGYEELVAKSDVDEAVEELKSEADKVITDLKESHKKEVEQLLIEIMKLKNRIAPKQSDKTLQERLNEVCKKHGVSTLQDLDWAFCESEKRRTNDCIKAVKEIYHAKYKRCLAMARWCDAEVCNIRRTPLCDMDEHEGWRHDDEFWQRWQERWLKIVEQFKEAK